MLLFCCRRVLDGDTDDEIRVIFNVTNVTTIPLRHLARLRGLFRSVMSELLFSTALVTSDHRVCTSKTFLANAFASNNTPWMLLLMILLLILKTGFMIPIDPTIIISTATLNRL